MNEPFQPRILGLILARGGSKRLPGKNVMMLCGKPMVAWTIEASLACAAISETVVSTDSVAIAAVSREYGAQVPFLRDALLAADHSTSVESTIDAIDRLELLGRHFDAVMLLEPTSPLRASNDLDRVAELLTSRWDEADAVVAVGLVHREHPEDMKTCDQQAFLEPWLSRAAGAAAARKQPPWYPYGGAYAVKVSTLRQARTFYPPRLLGYAVERWQNYEVDDEFDFICVEAILKHRRATGSAGGAF